MKISVGNDHAGFIHKDAVIQFLKQKGHIVTNHGTNSEDSVDYPDFVHPVAQDVIKGTADKGILLCGSGNGVSMTANKYAAIRAAICWEEELATLARAHNDANVLCIPARFVSEKTALDMVDSFLNTSFEGGRHQKRVDKMCS
ncbi:MAG: ribose 5-phosphate isomerase B [Flavobacteriaceae bacterium]|jgi:ribose 5-phosphate isomerase B